MVSVDVKHHVYKLKLYTCSPSSSASLQKLCQCQRSRFWDRRFASVRGYDFLIAALTVSEVSVFESLEMGSQVVICVILICTTALSTTLSLSVQACVKHLLFCSLLG